MRWPAVALLVVLTGCAGGPDCTLTGCASLLTLTLPAGTKTAKACVNDVCAEDVTGGTLQVPLSRKGGDTAVEVVVTLDGKTLRGTVSTTRTMPNGPDCGPVCVSAAATVTGDEVLSG